MRVLKETQKLAVVNSQRYYFLEINRNCSTSLTELFFYFDEMLSIALWKMSRYLSHICNDFRLKIRITSSGGLSIYSTKGAEIRYYLVGVPFLGLGGKE